jgi:hypothetical protein
VHRDIVIDQISVMKLFDASTGIFGLNALHVLQDPAGPPG